jgi:hypothetical protein
MNRAYSTFEIKAVTEGETRTITGIATSPQTDRVGDVVEPLGVQFKNPMPLLMHHEHDEPVGLAEFGKPTAKGVPFTANFPMIMEDGELKDRIEEAWQSVKAGLIRAVSIGFRAIESENIAGTWGTRYLQTEVFELSLVTIPCNTDATIQTIKSFDHGAPAASGKSAHTVVRLGKPAGASAPVVKQTPKVPKPLEGNMKTIAQQIQEFEATLVSKSAEMSSIMDKASEDGTTLDAEQSEAFDTLEAEVGAVNKHIARLKGMQKAQAQSAKPVDGSENRIRTVENTGLSVRVKNTQKLEPGIAFARAAKCLALGHLEHRDAISIAKAMYDGQEGVIEATQRLVTKAAVAPGTTSQTTWAAPLVGEETSVFADFVAFLRPQTILGRFGQAGVPALRRVPFRTALIGQTSGGDGYWVGEGQAKPLTKMDFSRTTIEPLKVANIAVATMELIRDSNPAADGLIRDTLAAALRERLDIDFINPLKAAVSGISPASILNGVSSIPSSGSTADDVRTDVKALFTAFIQANNAPTSGVWLMSSVTALALSLMMNPLGQTEFPGIGMNGGTFFGLPVIVSQYIPTDSSGSLVALVNASDIYEADEGGIDLSMSTEASLQMDSAPDNPSTASTVLVSLWQRNLVGFRAERTINWARRRTSAVAYLSGVSWGA